MRTELPGQMRTIVFIKHNAEARNNFRRARATGARFNRRVKLIDRQLQFG